MLTASNADVSTKRPVISNVHLPLMLSTILGRLRKQCIFVSVIITALKVAREVQIERRKIQFIECIHFVNYENKQEAVRISGYLCVQDDTVMDGIGGSNVFECGSRRLHSLR